MTDTEEDVEIDESEVHTMLEINSAFHEIRTLGRSISHIGVGAAAAQVVVSYGFSGWRLTLAAAAFFLIGLLIAEVLPRVFMDRMRRKSLMEGDF